VGGGWVCVSEVIFYLIYNVYFATRSVPA
jgi:hypothetical protein